MHTNIALLPLPAAMERDDGELVLGEGTRIRAVSGLEKEAGALSDALGLVSTFAVPVEADEGSSPAAGNVVTFHLDDHIPAEGYRLDVKGEGITVAASGPPGAFYAVQTLLQLLGPAIDDPAPERKEEAWAVPRVRILDQPRFAWRGFMLDEGRHFHGKAAVKKLIDAMARVKMNRFHWHLTDDQGWRVAVDSYPRLVEVGSKRDDTQVGFYFSPMRNGKPHGGYYSKQDVREVVAYAADRHVTVVPEVEFPGHCTAALAAYPEVSCTGEPVAVATSFGIKKDVLCIGKERALELVQGVLDEIVELFPSRLVHVGGDETPRDRWRECPDCRARMTTEAMKEPGELQGYFTRRIQAHLARKGVSIVGWNEILEHGLDASVVVQYWLRHADALVGHMARGGKVVMSQYLSLYLNHDYIATPLRKTYDFDPAFSIKEVPESCHANIEGIEAPLWSEWIRTERRLFWQVFPRLLAVAETGWTPRDRKDYASFRDRARACSQRLAVWGIEGAPMDVVDPPWYRRIAWPVHLFIEGQGRRY
ncbi:MAG: beta-N-acetylhexosaminidase [Candidatus Lokiarchaeota archaeon]|nr:beta-N-acetylhexosaminidase [Candidatus Lokiarchaeota archaeon]